MDFGSGTTSSEDFLRKVNNWAQKMVDVRKEYEACFPWLKESMVKKIYPPTNEALIMAFNTNITNIAAGEGIDCKFQALKELEQASTRTAKWRPPRDVNAHLRPVRIQARRQYLAILKTMIDVKTDTHNESIARIEKTLSEVREKTRQLNAVSDACEPRLLQLAKIEEIGCKLLDSSPFDFKLEVN